MKQSTIKLLLAMLLVCMATTGVAEKKSVFIYAGQSNADGREYVQNLPDYMKVGESPYSPYTHLRFAQVCGNPTKSTFDTRTMATGERYAFCDVTNYWIDQAVSENFYAIKCAYGGTAIAPGVTVAKLPIWYADAEWMTTHNAYCGQDITQEAYANNNSLTKNLTEGVASLIDGTLTAIDGGYDVKAIMWHQGESDRNAAGDYYTNFKTMIAYMRQAIYAKTGDPNDLTLPFIFGTVCRRSSQYSAGVEAAQMQVAAEDDNVYLIDMKNATLLSDNLHFDKQATEYLGKKMYNKLVELELVPGGSAIDVEEFPVKESVMDAVVVPSPDNRSWDFSAISQATLDALAADVALESGALWNYNSGWGYRRGNSIEEEQLHTAADYVIPETQGLYFTSSVYNRVSVTSSALGFISSDAHLLIPKMVAGQTVTFTVRANKNTINVNPDLDTQSLVELVSETNTVGTSYTTVTYRVRYNVTLPTHMGFTMGGGFLQKVQVKTPNTVNILIGADQKETFACDQPLDFSPFTDLFKAYVVTGYDDATGKIDCEQVLQVPAKTGVLLIGEESTVNAPILEEAPEAPAVNLLTAVVGEGSAPANSFVLTTSGGVTQFTKTNVAANLENQAYLASLGSLDAYDFNLMAAKAEHVYDMPTVLTGVSTLTFTDDIHHTATDGSKSVDLYCPANVVAMDGRFAFTNSGWGIVSNRLGANKGNTLYGSVVTLENGDRVKLEWGANDASAVHVYDLAGILRGVSAGGEVTNGGTYVVEAGVGETVNLDLKMYCGSNRAGFSKITVWTATETTPIYQVTTPTATVELQQVREGLYKAVATLSCETEGITYYYKGGDAADWTVLEGSSQSEASQGPSASFEPTKKAECQFKATASGYADSETLTLSLGYRYALTKTVVDLSDEAVFTASTKDTNGFSWTTANYVKMTGMPEGTVYGHISSASVITGISVQNNNTDARYSFAKGYGLACNYGYWVKTTEATAYDFAEYEMYDINTAEIQTSKVMVYNPNNTEYVFRPLKTVRLYEPVEMATVTIQDIGYATFCSESALDFTGSGVEAYYATADGDNVKFDNAIMNPAANTGLLLKAPEGDYEVLKVASGTDVSSTNLLKANFETKIVGTTAGCDYGKVFILSKHNSQLGFYKSNNGRELVAGKSYLYIENPSEVRLSAGYPIDGQTTDIGLPPVNVRHNEEGIYNLRGQRLTAPVKGMNVINGKIIMIK